MQYVFLKNFVNLKLYNVNVIRLDIVLINLSFLNCIFTTKGIKC